MTTNTVLTNKAGVMIALVGEWTPVAGEVEVQEHVRPMGVAVEESLAPQWPQVINADVLTKVGYGDDVANNRAYHTATDVVGMTRCITTEAGENIIRFAQQAESGAPCEGSRKSFAEVTSDVVHAVRRGTCTADAGGRILSSIIANQPQVFKL